MYVYWNYDVNKEKHQIETWNRRINKKIKMTSQELYKKVLLDFNLEKIHPLHQAIMEECCENVLNNPEKLDEESLASAVKIAFYTSNEVLRGTLRGSMEVANSDQITLNYREQSFEIGKDSPLLK